MYANTEKKNNQQMFVFAFAEISIFLSADTITVFKENFKYITVYNISSSKDYHHFTFLLCAIGKHESYFLPYCRVRPHAFLKTIIRS